MLSELCGASRTTLAAHEGRCCWRVSAAYWQGGAHVALVGGATAAALRVVVGTVRIVKTQGAQ
jgi:hypothetical protein